MIQNPLLEKYRKGDLVQYFNNVIEILTVERAEALKVAPQRETLNEVMTQFNQLWQPNKGSELTPQIEELDVERDIFSFMRKRKIKHNIRYGKFLF